MAYLETALGYFGNILFLVRLIIFLGIVPLLVWLIIAFVSWFRKRKASFRAWVVMFSTCLSLVIASYIYQAAFGFNSAWYIIAHRIHVYIPVTVQVLENDQETSRDEVEEYVVVRFSQSQMDKFIQSVQLKDWKYGMVIPDVLRHPKPYDFQDAMIGRKYPLPKVKMGGWYYSFIKKRYGTGDWYTTRMAYFLDVKAKILYIYYDDAQWG